MNKAVAKLTDRLARMEAKIENAENARRAVHRGIGLEEYQRKFGLSKSEYQRMRHHGCY